MSLPALLLALALGPSHTPHEPQLPPAAAQEIREAEERAKRTPKNKRDCKSACAQTLDMCLSNCQTHHIKDCSKTCSKISEPCQKECAKREKARTH